LFTSQTSTNLEDFSINVTNFPSTGLWLEISQPTGGPVTSASYQAFTGPTAVVGLTLESPAALGPGFYNDSVNFSLCYDSACQNLVPGSPVTEPLDFIVSTTPGKEYTIQSVALAGASAVAWDSASQELYATTVEGGAHSDSLVQIDPTTGTVGASMGFPVALTQLAISDDGQYAYVASKGESTVYRVELPSLTVDTQIPLGSIGTVPNTLYQMAVAPGEPQTLAISLDDGGSPEYTPGVVLFDGAVQRQNLLPPLNSRGSPAQIAWGVNASTLYALRVAPASPVPVDFGEIDTVTASASGLAIASAWSINLQNDVVGRLVYAAGRLYGLDAIVRDATTETILGQFTVPSGYEVISLLPDPANLRVFILADSPRTPLLLLCYDMQSFAMTSVTALDADIGGYPLNMTLWGTNGIAFEYGENTVAVLAGAFR